MYKLVIHSEHKIIGKKKKKEASSLLPDIISLLTFRVAAQSYIPYMTGAMGGGVASGTVCDSSVYEFIHLYICMQ